MKINKLQLSQAKEKLVELDELLQEISNDKGISRQDVLNEIYNLSSKKTKERIEKLKSEFKGIEKYSEEQQKIEERLEEQEIKFIKELRKSIKDKSANKTSCNRTLLEMSEFTMKKRYLDLKDFFLKERNEKMHPGFIGFMSEEEFKGMVQENPKLLTYSIDKIRHTTKIINGYYNLSQTNVIIKEFPNIYGNSAKKMKCNLEIAKDEDVTLDMLEAPKNYMCSPTRIYQGIRKWKRNKNVTLRSAIMSGELLDDYLPQKYKDIIDNGIKIEEKARMDTEIEV